MIIQKFGIYFFSYFFSREFPYKFDLSFRLFPPRFFFEITPVSIFLYSSLLNATYFIFRAIVDKSQLAICKQFSYHPT